MSVLGGHVGKRMAAEPRRTLPRLACMVIMPSVDCKSNLSFYAWSGTLGTEDRKISKIRMGRFVLFLPRRDKLSVGGMD